MTPRGPLPSLRRRVAQVARVLASPEQARRGRRRPWVLLLMSALALALPVLLIWVLAPSGRGAGSLAVVVPAVLCVGLGMMWALVVFDVVQQNRPELARLVPGHVAVLRRALWTAAACLCAVVATGATLLGFAVWPALTVMALVFGGVAVAIRWPWALLATPLLAWDPQSMPVAITGPVESMADRHPAAMAVAAVALMAATLRAVVLSGSAYHRRYHRRLESLSAMAKNRDPADRAAAPGVFLWGWQQRMFQAAYVQRLNRLIGSPLGSADDRLALGLGPQADRSSQYLVVFCAYLLPTVLSAIEAVRPGTLGEGLLAGTVMGVVFTVLALPQQVAAVLSRTRREQTLLRLLPGTPQGAALNRLLARRFATMLAVLIIVNMVGTAGVAAIAPPLAAMPRIIEVVLGVMALSPVLVLVLWRDWSRLGDGVSGWPVLVLGSVCGFAGTAYAWTAVAGQPWWGLLGVTACVLLAFGPWRWRRALQAPVAWPVGRYA